MEVNMDWLLLAVLSAVVMGANSLLIKKVMRFDDSVGLGIIIQVVGSIIFGGLILFSNNVWPSDWIAYLAMLIAGFCWVGSTYYGFKAYNLDDVSILGPLGKTSLIWTLLFGFLLLGEAASWQKIIGVALILAGALVLAWKKNLFKELVGPGVKYMLLAAFFVGCAYIADKKALEYFQTNLYTFLAFATPLVLFLILFKNPYERTKQIIRNNAKNALLVGILDCAWYALLMMALSVSEATLVNPILQTSLVVSVIGGIVLLKEKKNLLQKIAGSIVILLGAVIVVS